MGSYKKWIGVGIFAILLVIIASAYNGLVRSSEAINGKWSQVENQLQRRGDLIPNLVNTVKGYAVHEQKAIQAVADARAKLGGATSPVQKANAEQELSSALSRLLVVVENYPNLKADQNFRQLTDELSGTENRLAVARKDYNEAVQVYNTNIQSFPTVVMARMFGFNAREYFKADEAAKGVPKVSF